MAATVTNTENLMKALTAPTDLKVYIENFERHFLEATKAYLRRQRCKRLATHLSQTQRLRFLRTESLHPVSARSGSARTTCRRTFGKLKMLSLAKRLAVAST
jgi:hypothetical protein